MTCKFVKSYSHILPTHKFTVVMKELNVKGFYVLLNKVADYKIEPFCIHPLSRTPISCIQKSMFMNTSHAILTSHCIEKDMQFKPF